MRVGLMGVAHWHAPIYAAALRAAAADIAWVWDAVPGTAERFAAAEQAPLLKDAADIAAGSCDAVIVMGRPAEMAARLEIVMASGIPAIVEKPITPDARPLAALAARIAAASAHVAVALPQRASPIWQARRELLRDGRFGQVSHAQFRIINGPPERYRIDGVPWMLDPEISGGGALRNLGIHGVDAFLHLAGDQPVHIEHVSFGRNLRAETVEDYALLTLRAEDGALGLIEAGYCHASMAPGGEFEWRINAANASLVDRGDRATMTILDRGVTGQLPCIAAALRYNVFIADALARIRQGQPPAASVADCLRAMQLIDQAYAATTKGKGSAP